MTRRYRRKSRLCALALAFLILPFRIEGAASTGQSNVVPGEMIVKIRAELVVTKGVPAEQQLRLKLQTAGLATEAVKLTPLLKAPFIDEFETVFLVRVSPSLAPQLLQTLAEDPDIDYVAPNHVFRVQQFSTNDSLLGEQWGLQAIRALKAWTITRGSPDVLVAVIDTGIDYTHPDLRDQIWINPGEDLNRNGRVDSTDFNQIDDDGNGFVDDIQGWDFTDAPNFIDLGDYLERDADPRDENGHGTAVAGIIAARGNNGQGIAGVAYGCRLMNLRAGTSLGFLEEDDVAAAVLYAVTNGARVINMSFGDVVVSPLLRDVIRYAYARGVILVASSGNSGTDEPHYPSGFSETISVGAVTRNRIVAGFSNYGISLDVVAPGQEIWTTRLDGGYQMFAGTSAAAPFVSGLAALILSRHPQWQPEQIRTILTTSAQDLGQTGWDEYYGAGLIDAYTALQIQEGSVARITYPRMDEGLSGGTIPIVGTAAGAFMDNVTLEFGTGNNPDSWNPLASLGKRQIVGDTLAFWNLASLPDTIYTLRLRIHNQNGRDIEDKVRVYLDRTPPVIRDVTLTPMIDGDRYSVLISFQVDDLSQAMLFWRIQGESTFNKIPLNYVTREHRYNFPEDYSSGRPVEFYLQAVNRSGLLSEKTEIYLFDFSPEPISELQLYEVPVLLPPGLLMSRMFDMNANGLREVAVSLYENGGQIGSMAIFEWGPGGFQQRFITDHRAIPRDVGDADGDGLMELLAGLGQWSFIYEATRPRQFPEQIVWIDTSNFWAARFADLDADGAMEIIGRRGEMWQVLENSGDNQFTFVDSLPNPTRGSNFTGVPHAEIGDFDADGRREVLFGDYDGDIYLYEAIGDNRFVAIWTDSLPLMDTIDFLTAGDFNGDGRTDFAVAAHSDPSLNKEHEFDARHWMARIYQSTGDNRYEPVWEQRFFGFFPPRDFDSGLGSGDLDGDGKDELILSLFPDLYLIQYDPAAQVYKSRWHFRTARSNTALIEDPGDGMRTLLFNDGEKFVGFRMAAPDDRPPPPIGFDAYPLSESEIRLTWRPLQGITQYQVYRGPQPDALNRLAVTHRPSYVDSAVISGKAYIYAVTAVDSSRSIPESQFSRFKKVVPGPGPKLLQATFLPPDHLTLLFSEPLSPEARNPVHFLVDSSIHPESVALTRGGQEAVLALGRIQPGTHRIVVRNVRDVDRTPISSGGNTAFFTVPGPEKKFYLVAATLISDRLIRLHFNLPVDPGLASEISRYELSEPLVLEKAAVDEKDSASVLLYLKKQRRIAPLGRNFKIRVRNLASRSGIPIEKGIGDVIGFTLAARNLDRVFVYPNPFIPARHKTVMIAGLTGVAEIKILDERGRPVASLREDDGNGGVPWDGKDETGTPLPSGIYIVYVTDGSGQKAFTKIALIR